MLPETLQAPHLHRLAVVGGFALPIGSQLFMTAVGLVSVWLRINHPSAYFEPDVLLQWLSFTPQLRDLIVIFTFPVPDDDVAVYVYLEAIFVNTIENFMFDSAKFEFFRTQGHMEVYPREEVKTHAFSINTDCPHLDGQVSFVAQVFNVFGQVFSEMEHVTLEHKIHGAHCPHILGVAILVMHLPHSSLELPWADLDIEHVSPYN
ncbi:hypothetical protein F5888DRAFT_1803299 [Russula emetica]|nr:hypothetical protein F5888DRAFT_1803299 [Russula emetica]